MSRKRATKLPSVILLMLSTVCLHHVIPSAHAQSSPDQTSNTDPAAGTDIRGTNGDVTDPDPPEEIGPDDISPSYDIPNPNTLHVEELYYDFTEPQDVVVLFDRSGSIGFYALEEDGKNFMETMLRTGYIIHPNYTRLAVLSYAGTVKTELDSITGRALTGCELFAKEGLWDGIRYDPDDDDGANYRSAMDLARSILSAGRLMRPDVTSQSVWMVTDGEFVDEETKLWASYVKDDGVKLYGAGMGHHLNEEKMRSIVSTPGDYYYHRTSDWLDILTSGALAKRNVTDGLYQVVDMSLCDMCGSGATCYCDSLSDRQPLCACSDHFYPSGDQCIECPSGRHKSVWGNKTCAECSDKSSLLGGVSPDRCNSEVSLVVIIAVVVGGVVIVIALIVCVFCLCRKKRRKRHGSDSSDGESPNTIYTQTYSTPESARALVGTNSTQKTLIGHANTGAFPVLKPQTSNMSTDSGVSLSTTPHYIDPTNNNNNLVSRSNNISVLPSGGSSSILNHQREKNINVSPPSVYSSHDYIDVVDPTSGGSASGSDSDHEDPQTIANLSLKFRHKHKNRGKSKKHREGKAARGRNKGRAEQPSRRREEVVGAAGKPRMPSPSREAGQYENAPELNRLQRLKNRISSALGMSNDYSNAEEINKLKKHGGRASAKISAYQVKNIIHMFEKSDGGDDGGPRGRTQTMPSNLPSSPPTKTNADGSTGVGSATSNGVVLRVHNNLAATRSDPVGAGRGGRGTRTLPVIPSGAAAPGQKPLNLRVPRPSSTHSMDEDGYMKPVINQSNHASYIDLIPDPKVPNNTNNNAAGSQSGPSSHASYMDVIPDPKVHKDTHNAPGSKSGSEDDGLYEPTTLPGSRC